MGKIASYYWYSLEHILIVAMKIVSVHTLKHSNSILREVLYKILEHVYKDIQLQLCVEYQKTGKPLFNRRVSLDASEGWGTVGDVGEGSGDKGRNK